ncbi:MAG: acyl-CoA dehydrogenase family protein, partial [Gammaproteobacteria bacterium]
MFGTFTPREEELIEQARTFRERIVKPNAAVWERDKNLPRDYFLAAAEHDLCGLLVPQELGGQALSNGALAMILFQLARSCFASTFALVVHNNLASNISKNGGSEHLAVLPDMIAGRTIGAFLLTEPSAGSDAAAISTLARANDKGYILNGSKAWITNGTNADILSVYAQTEAGAGSKGIANFLVEAENTKIERTPRYELLGAAAMNVCGFEFRDVQVPSGSLMIEAGGAFRVAMQGIDLARTLVAAMCCAMIDAGLKHAVAYTKERQVFRKAVAEHQYPQHALADVSTDLEASLALTRLAVEALDGQHCSTVRAAHAKKFTTKVALSRIADCMQMMGAAGAI